MVVVRGVRNQSGSQLDKVLVPDPSNQIVGVVLIFGKPELAFLANDVEDLEKKYVVSI